MRTIPISVIVAAALVVPVQLVADENDDLFTRIDANQDGFVTEDEVNPEHKAHFERMLRDCSGPGWDRGPDLEGRCSYRLSCSAQLARLFSEGEGG